MGLFDFLSGRKPAPPGTPQQSPQALRQALMALNRDSAPYGIRDGGPEGCDLLAEWRIVDARWYEVFAKAGLTKVAQILMKFDAARAEVRAVDRDWTVEWRAGIPAIRLSAEGFRGRKVEMSFGAAVAFRETGEFGKVYDYGFRTGEMKGPLQAAVAAAGWSWKGVAFGKL